MKNASLSYVKASSLHHTKYGNSVMKTKEVQSIQESVNNNFSEFKRIKWLNVLRDASKEYRKGAQYFLK